MKWLGTQRLRLGCPSANFAHKSWALCGLSRLCLHLRIMGADQGIKFRQQFWKGCFHFTGLYLDLEPSSNKESRLISELGFSSQIQRFVGQRLHSIAPQGPKGNQSSWYLCSP